MPVAGDWTALAANSILTKELDIKLAEQPHLVRRGAVQRRRKSGVVAAADVDAGAKKADRSTPS